MAEQTKPAETKAKTKAVEAKAAETKSDAPKGVTLYHRDGREFTTTDASKVVDLEFNGWSQDKSVFDRKKSK